MINLLSVCFEKVTYKQKIKWPKSYGKYQTLKENRKKKIDNLLKISRKNVILRDRITSIFCSFI